MKIFEMTLTDELDEYGLSAISLVEKPAIEEDFVRLSKQDEIVMLAEADKEKRLLVGAALVPDKLILRKNEDGEKYQIYFTEDTIRLAAQKYLMEGLQNNATIEHQSALVEGVHLVESWIVEDPEKDKTANYGLSYPKGTWAVALKVMDEKLWDDFVETGKVKGFSIEGRFIHSPKTELSVEESEVDQLTRMIKEAIDVVERS